MREIKFRAWAKNNRKMEYFTIKDRNYYVFKDDGTAGEHYEVMQYTGLKDKNGKEIYEGDIFTTRHPDFSWDVSHQVNGKVVWGEPERGKYDCCYFFVIGLHKYFVWTSGFAYGKNVAIIGNIYENPELLEGEEIGVKTKEKINVKGGN